MNDRMSDNEALVELAAQAHYESLEWGGCAGGGWIRQPEGPRKDRMDAMRAALLAVGLPALLERVAKYAPSPEVEALLERSSLGTAEAEAARDSVSHDVGRLIVRLSEVMAERDALVAKVTRVEVLLIGAVLVDADALRTALDASETP